MTCVTHPQGAGERRGDTGHRLDAQKVNNEAKHKVKKIRIHIHMQTTFFFFQLSMMFIADDLVCLFTLGQRHPFAFTLPGEGGEHSIECSFYFLLFFAIHLLPNLLI